MSVEAIFGKPDFHGFKKLSDRVYVYFSYVNTTVILADDGVCLVDSQVNSGQVQRLHAEIKKITSLPIKYVINTHYHWDHVIGNRYFKEQGATIYAHDLTKRFMETRMKRQWAFLKGRGFSMDEPLPTLPDVTFNGQMDLSLPGINLELRHLGATETDDMTSIYLPREKFLCTGDTLLTGSFPIFGMAVMNEGLSEDGAWLDALQKVTAYGATHLIPGHGPLGSQKDVDLMARIQRYFLGEVERYVNEGLPLAEIEKRINRDLPEDIRRLPEVWGTVNYAIYRAFHSMTGWMTYKPTAIPWASEEKLLAALSKAENDPEKIEQSIDEAMRERQFDVALSLAKALTERDPQEAQYRAILAECLIEAARTTTSILEKGDFFNLAKKELDEALECDPLNALANLVKGMFFIIRAEKNGTDPMEGIRLLEKAKTSGKLSNARLAKVHFGLALGLFQTGQMEKAGEECKVALELNPHFVPAQGFFNSLKERR